MSLGEIRQLIEDHSPRRPVWDFEDGEAPRTEGSVFEDEAEVYSLIIEKQAEDLRQEGLAQTAWEKVLARLPAGMSDELLQSQSKIKIRLIYESEVLCILFYGDPEERLPQASEPLYDAFKQEYFQPEYQERSSTLERLLEGLLYLEGQNSDWYYKQSNRFHLTPDERRRLSNIERAAKNYLFPSPDQAQ